MLIVNGKKLNLNEIEDAFVKDVYIPSMEALKKLDQKNYTFAEPENKISINHEGVEEHSSGTYVRMRQNCSFILNGNKPESKTIGYDVRYFETSSYDSKNNEVFTPVLWNFPGTALQVKMNEKPDLLWFLIFASPSVEPIDGLEKFQNQLREPVVQYKLQNSAADAEITLRQKRRLQNVSNLILDEEGLAGADLKVAARNFNISVTDLSEDQIRVTLEERIMRRNKHTGKYDWKLIESFEEIIRERTGKSSSISDINLMGHVKSLIAEAQELKILTNKKGVGNRIEWWLNENLITKHAPSMNKDDEILKVFMQEEEERTKLEKAVREKKM